jgi:ATP-dependent DNA ligase
MSGPLRALRYKGTMELPVRPPLAPMLARLARELPAGDYLYEPKWDGFRCLAFRSGDLVDLRSRNDRPLGRYFPELMEAILALTERRFVLDAEIVVPADSGFDFEALLARLHPAASRVERLRAETPASLISFDLPAVADEDLRSQPFAERRARLVRLVEDAPHPIRLTEITEDREVAAEWLDRSGEGGIDGVVAKRRSLPYTAGAREMIKVKAERTADCTVAGFRWLGGEPVVSSLLLGLWDSNRELRHVGVASQFPHARRRALAEELVPLAGPLEGHPWEHGFLVAGSPIGRLKGAAGSWRPGEMALDWVPLAPVRVCEVAYDHLDAGRFRHPARFRRWRDDRDPYSCTFEQFERCSPANSLPAVRRT